MNLPLNIDVQQILLHMFNFVLLFGGLYFILYKPVRNFMDDRKKLYDDMDLKANKSLKEAEGIKTEYEQKIAAAEDEVKQIKNKGIEEAENEAKIIVKDAENEAAEIIAKAKKLAETEKEKALKSANREISELAMEATKKIMFNSTSDSFDAFLNSAEEKENA